MFVLDRTTHKFLDVNAAALAQYGYSHEEFLQMNSADILAPEEVPRLKQALRQVGNVMAPQGHWRHRRRDGTVFEVDVTSQGVTLPSPEAMLVVAQDLGAGRPAKHESPEPYAYLQALLENLPLAVMVLDRERRIQMCNPAFERIFGYRLEDIKNAKPETFMEPPGRMAEAASIIKRVMVGEVVREQAKRKRRDGLLVDVQALIVPLILHGNRIGSVGIYEDIGARCRAEQAQQQAEEKYQRLFENAIEGIFQTTPDGRYLSANPALARMYGYSSPTELMETVQDIGKSVYVDPQTREEFKKIIEEQGFVEAFESRGCQERRSKIWISENARGCSRCQRPGRKL